MATTRIVLSHYLTTGMSAEIQAQFALNPGAVTVVAGNLVWTKAIWGYETTYEGILATLPSVFESYPPLRVVMSDTGVYRGASNNHDLKRPQVFLSAPNPDGLCTVLRVEGSSFADVLAKFKEVQGESDRIFP